MRIIEKYNKKVNYIGCSDFQYKLTNFIYLKYCAINYTAYVHDTLYKFLWSERYFIPMLIFKILFDLVFLIMGIFRSLRNLQPIGATITIILYLILTIATPYYIYRIYKYRDLKK